VWRIADGEQQLSFQADTGFISSVLFLSAESLATCGKEGLIKIWDVRGKSDTSPPLLRSLQGFSNLLHGMAMTPNGDFLVTSGDDKQLLLWDLREGKEGEELLTILLGHEDFVWAVAVAIDGKSLVSGDMSGKMKRWDLGEKSGNEVLEEEKTQGGKEEESRK